MKLAPGTPLTIGLWTNEAQPPLPLGRLAMADHVAQLEWSAQALATGWSLAPVRYAMESGLIAARMQDFGGLHGFLADSLPDAWGALLLKRRLAKLGHRYEALNAVDRLALVGRNGRGALVFEPATLTNEGEAAIDLDRLAKEARHVLLGEESALHALLTRLGGGSGGARPKVHVTFEANGALKASDDMGGSGDSAWIVKFPAIGDPEDIGPIEETYARMARAAGLSMAETRLIASASGPGHFASRRFDRPAPGQRLHMISLSGALEARMDMPSLGYDAFLRATLAITRDMRDVEQVFRRMVFNVLAHNRDDHAAQHAYLMDLYGDWHLAPAYDLTFADGPGGEHYMDVEGEGHTITRDHVTALGARHGIAAKRMAAIIDEVRAAIADWPVHAAATGVRQSAPQIRQRLEQVGRAFG